MTSRAHSLLFPSLQRLTAKCIWDNKHLFYPDEDVNLFTLIPKKLRAHLVNEFLRFLQIELALQMHEDPSYSEDILLHRSFTLLLNEEVVEFIFPKTMSWLSWMGDKCGPNPFWMSVLQNCPSLKRVSCNIFPCIAMYDRARFFNFLMSMKHLQVIKLKEFCCDDSNLCAIAVHLSNLSVLRVQLEEHVSEKGFKALSNLQLLEEFVFFERQSIINRRNSHQADRKHFQLCNQLPKLRFAGKRFIYDDYKYPLHSWLYLGDTVNDGLRQVSKPWTLGLQELIASSLPKGIFLPNLTALHLCRPSSDFQCDSRLTKVSELGIYAVTMDTCVHILSQIGRQVKILRLNVTDTLEINVIFNLCPTLKHLSVYDISGQLTVEDQVNPGTLRQLNKLEFRSRSHSNNVEARVLLQLLQAPELHQLVLLDCKEYSQQDNHLEEIISMLQQKKILQKLELAVLGNIEKSDFFKFVIDAMILHCPNLIDVCCINFPMFELCWQTDKHVV